MRNETQPLAVVSDSAPWKLVVLVVTGTTLISIYLLVTVAIFRVSKSYHSFILFLSEAAANIGVLAVGMLGYSSQLCHTHLMGDPVLEFLLVSTCSYASHLHYLLIAVNRAFAIFLPLKYDVWWTRRNIIASVATVWLIGGALQLVNIVNYATMHATPLFMPIYGYVQRCVTLPSLCIYSSAVGWVLFNRLLQCIKSHNAVTPTTSVPNLNYVHAIDLRIFAYCFASFLPNCYHIVVLPPPNSMHWQMYAIIRLASPGLLLLAMSSMVREQIPSCGAQRLFIAVFSRIYHPQGSRNEPVVVYKTHELTRTAFPLAVSRQEH